MNDNIAKHETIVEIVGAYEKARDEIVAAFLRIDNAMKDINRKFVLDEHAHLSIHIRERWGRITSINFSKPDDVLANLRRDVWQLLISRLDLRRIMSMKRWAEFSKQVESEDPPPIDVATITAFGKQYHAMIPEMLNESVREVFDFLRPSKRYDQYKTNNEFEVGPRVILERYVEPAYRSDRFTVNYHYTQNLTALENVFSMLVGDGFINKTHTSTIENAIKACSDGKGETKYFAFKCFKKGTLHIRFKQLDAVRRLNEIAGGKNFKPRTKY